MLSHQTALDLHDLCDVNPTRIHPTVPLGYRLRRELPSMYEMHPRALDASDVILHEAIPIVTVRRAILNGIDVGLGGQVIDQAVATAGRRGFLERDGLEEIAAVRETRQHQHQQGVWA